MTSLTAGKVATWTLKGIGWLLVLTIRVVFWLTVGLIVCLSWEQRVVGSEAARANLKNPRWTGCQI